MFKSIVLVILLSTVMPAWAVDSIPHADCINCHSARIKMPKGPMDIYWPDKVALVAGVYVYKFRGAVFPTPPPLSNPGLLPFPEPSGLATLLSSYSSAIAGRSWADLIALYDTASRARMEGIAPNVSDRTEFFNEENATSGKVVVAMAASADGNWKIFVKSFDAQNAAHVVPITARLYPEGWKLLVGEWEMTGLIANLTMFFERHTAADATIEMER